MKLIFFTVFSLISLTLDATSCVAALNEACNSAVREYRVDYDNCGDEIIHPEYCFYEAYRNYDKQIMDAVNSYDNCEET